MASKATSGVLKQIEDLFRTGLASGLTDGQLLDRFMRRGDSEKEIGEAAFATLIDRHGSMVLRVCRDILNDEHAAEDAAQATFLVLARRADSVERRESIGAWLQGVAVRVARKARVADIRRQIRERRVAQGASQSVDPDQGAEDPERWLELHRELGRLPETFRAPLVLCYLEGLTQEQAAAQLRCPVGTVQSRLARGRERLKARLIGRGCSPVSGFLVPGLEISGFQNAPTLWKTATTRAAIQFITQGSGAIRAGAGPASAGLALEVLREMGFFKLKFALAVSLASAMAVTTAAGFWASAQGDPPKTTVETAKPQPQPAPAAAAPKAPADRVVSGIVRDNQGRPMAKVWVGSDPRPMQDEWDNPSPRDIRECKEPFRNATGAIMPPGAVGKYFELRNAKGVWHPISPDDINPFDPIVWGDKGVAQVREEVAKNHSRYTVRKVKGRWWMASAVSGVLNAIRTDTEGRFSIELPKDQPVPSKLHFASADYSLQAIHTFKRGDPLDQPLDIKLRPTRHISVRIIETPRDDPKASMTWTVYTVDALGKPESEWQSWSLPNPNAHDPSHMKRHLDVRLPAGRYKLELRSETMHRVVDLAVPLGDGPLDLPDLKVESLATFQNVGKPAEEIHALDLEGRPVRLSDFRGKVIVLDFWATWCGPCVAGMPKLIKLQERFRDRPIVFLALHDGSVDGPAAYEKAVASIKERFWEGVDLPLLVLLDRPLEGDRRLSYDIEPGAKGSGWSADTYEVTSWPSTFVIDPAGRLVGKVELETLEGVLEDQLGLPRSKPDEPPAEPIEISGRNVKVRGKVVGPNGKPVVGAHVWPQNSVVRLKEIRTDSDGVFEYTAEQILYETDNGIRNFHIKVEAANLAPKIFKIDVKGPIDVTLNLGVGMTITGRVTRDGKPVVGASVMLQQGERGMRHFLGFPKTKTDQAGHFRFDRAFPDDDLCCSVKLAGSDSRDVVMPRNFRSTGEGTILDLGGFEVRPGHKLAGRVVFADGKTIPAGTKIGAWLENAGGPDAAKVGIDGRFEILGLPDGVVGCNVIFPDARKHLPDGYRLSAKNPGVSPLSPYMIYGLLDRDIDDFTILFEPGEPPRSPNLDPGLLADFEEAKKTTIRGVPPGVAPAR